MALCLHQTNNKYSNNNKLGLKLPRVSVILSQIQNGSFVYHNKLKSGYAQSSLTPPPSFVYIQQP